MSAARKALRPRPWPWWKCDPVEEHLNRLVEALSQWHPAWAYSTLLFSAFLENVIPPIPGDTVVVFSAYLVGRGALNWWLVYLSTCAGGTAGFLVMYWLGYHHGRAFLAGRKRRFFSAEDLARAEQWLARYGGILILVNRFLSGIRSVIAVSAGIGRMNWKSVAFYGFVSMAIWNGLLLYAGLLVGQNWRKVVEYLKQYNRFFTLLLVGIVLVLLFRWWRRRRSGRGLTS